jgi:hypothetical protein
MIRRIEVISNGDYVLLVRAYVGGVAQDIDVRDIDRDLFFVGARVYEDRTARGREGGDGSTDRTIYRR